MTLFSIGAANWFKDIWNVIWFSLNTMIYKVIDLLYQVFLNVAQVNLFSEDVFNKITGRLYIVMSIAMLFIFAYNLVFMIIDPDGKQKGSMSKTVKDTMISLVFIVLLPVIFNYLYVFQNHILESGVIDTLILGGTGNGDTSNCNTNDFDCTCSFPDDTFQLSNYKQTDISLDVLAGFSTTTTDSTVNLQSTMESKCNEYKNKLGFQKGASTIAGTIFSAFYYPSNFDYEYCSNYLSTGNDPKNVFSGDNNSKQICINYFTDLNITKYSGNISPFLNDGYLRAILSGDTNEMDFNYIFALVAGILACYMFICYALKIGVRVAKLGFLQIISPIPMMLRIIPGQNMFKKWFDAIKSTYLDVFMRVAIIDFTMFGISLVPDLINTIFNNSFSTDGPLVVRLLTLVIVILGLMQFANEAPQLFKDLFGGSGNFGLKSPGKQLRENKIAMGTLGAGATLGARTGNLLNNYGRIAKNKDLSGGQKIGQMLKNTGRLINPLGVGSAVAGGYNATKDGKNFGDGVKNASIKNLSSPGVLYKAKRGIMNAGENIGNMWKTDYSQQDTALLQKTNEKLGKVTSRKSEIYKSLDDNQNIKNIKNYYEQQIKKANESGDYKAAAELQQKQKEVLKAARGAVLKEKLTGQVAEIKWDATTGFNISNGSMDSSKIDISMKSSMDKYNTLFEENSELIKKSLIENKSSLVGNINANGDFEFDQTKFDALSASINSGDINTIDTVNKLNTALNHSIENNKNTIIDIRNKQDGNK